MEKVKAKKENTLLCVDASKDKFIPAYVYYLLEAYNCTEIRFNDSVHTYKQKDLKNARDWSEVIQNESK